MRALHCPVGVIRQLDARSITHKVARSKPLFALVFGPSAPSGSFFGSLDKWVWITTVVFGLFNDLICVFFELGLFSPEQGPVAVVQV